MTPAVRITWFPGNNIPWLVQLERFHSNGQKITTRDGQLSFSPYSGGSIELAYCELPDEDQPFAHHR